MCFGCLGCCEEKDLRNNCEARVLVGFWGNGFVWGSKIDDGRDVVDTGGSVYVYFE